MEENQPVKTQQPQPKNSGKGNWFVLLIGFFLIIRGIRRLSEEGVTVMSLLMLVVGAAGIVYYLLKR